MLIIYGTKAVTKKVGTGTFLCPNCGSDQPYWQKTLQEKGHLYWVSLVPLGDKQEFVECRTCLEQYHPDVLSFTPEGPEDAFKSHFEHVLSHLMVLMMEADEVIEESEIERIAEIFEAITSRKLTRDEVLAELAAARASGQSVIAYASSLAEILSEEGKELVVQALLGVAMADESIHEAEWQTMIEVAAALEMTESHLKGVLDSLVEPA